MGTPITPPVYWTASVSAPLAPGRLEESVGANVAEVASGEGTSVAEFASGAAAVRAAPEAFTRTGATNAAQIVRVTARVQVAPAAIAGRARGFGLRQVNPSASHCSHTSTMS